MLGMTMSYVMLEQDMCYASAGSVPAGVGQEEGGVEEEDGEDSSSMIVFVPGQEETVEFEKDVGVIVHQSLKPGMQCARAAARANAVLGQISRAVSYRDAKTFLKLYKVYVRPHLEYAVTSWSPWEVGTGRPWRKSRGGHSGWSPT